MTTETAFQPDAFQNDAFQVASQVQQLYGWRRGSLKRRMAHTLEEDIAASVLEMVAAERRRAKRLSDDWLLGLIDDDELRRTA